MLFQKAIRVIIRDVSPDVLVYCATNHETGFPPFLDTHPMVYDYVDSGPSWVDDPFIRRSPHTIAVSPALAERATGYGGKVVVIPNGTPFRSKNINRASAKKTLGLGLHPVVSLIGLTTSPNDYFVRAVHEVEKEIPDLVLLVVGGGKIKDRIETAARKAGVSHLRAVGHVDADSIRCYFEATDVGLYPCEDNAYYREACPQKVIEYTAARCQVVSTRVRFFEKDWPNIRFAQPTVEDFARQIIAAFRDPKPPRELSSDEEWTALSKRYETVLQQVVSQRS